MKAGLARVCKMKLRVAWRTGRGSDKAPIKYRYASQRLLNHVVWSGKLTFLLHIIKLVFNANCFWQKLNAVAHAKLFLSLRKKTRSIVCTWWYNYAVLNCVSNESILNTSGRLVDTSQRYHCWSSSRWSEAYTVNSCLLLCIIFVAFLYKMH